MAGEVIGLFMNKNIDKKEILLRAADVGEPTVEVELLEPLRFCCNRGDIFEIQESPVIARIEATKIPNFADLTTEATRFILESKNDIEQHGSSVQLRYPSLNKVIPGVFSRLHMGEGKQNTNRSIYYHAAYRTLDSHGQPQFISMWSIRDGVIDKTWRPASATGARPDDPRT
jgi:hypothetical protein